MLSHLLLRSALDYVARGCRSRPTPSGPPVTDSTSNSPLPEGPPLRNTAGRLGRLIDTRAAGVYVVGAESTISGRSYTPILDLPVTPLPPWMTGLLRTPERPPPPVFGPMLAGVQPRSRYAATALRANWKGSWPPSPGAATTP